MKEQDVKWDLKSYGWRANLGAVRLFVHADITSMGSAYWGADYDPHRGTTLRGIMGTMVKDHEPDGITHVSGETEDAEKAKHQAFLAAQYLLGTKLKKKTTGNGILTVIGGKKRK